MEYYAHKTETEDLQTVKQHLLGVSKLAEKYASVFDAGDFGKYIGLYHDIGKYSLAFQKRLLQNGPKVDHSTAGAQIMKKYGCQPGAFCIAGHHSGLQNLGIKYSATDSGTLLGRLRKELVGKLDYSAYKNDNLEIPVNLKNYPFAPKSFFELTFFTRMLFSCLVDADFLDTEAFTQIGNIKRAGFATVEELWIKIDKYIQNFWPPTNKLNQYRCAILKNCLEKAEQKPGLFSLTVPTGGGKTIASLAFALKHAQKYGKKRVIYVIPYTSIIEQNAEVFRNIVGDVNVVEHHMNADYDSHEDDQQVNRTEQFSNERKKLATENWDAPVIVTTNVQFFESFFGNKTSKCRKLHNVANSVVIFDEAQMLPINYLIPCINCIAELVKNYKVSAVLCTATQPNLNHFFEEDSIKLPCHEICEDVKTLYEIFRRVTFKDIGCIEEADLITRLKKEKQVLCIVNTKKKAKVLYQQLEGENVFHLSTNMYPEHRKRILQKIRACLAGGKKCKVISTSLIEAGVDVDFACVYRELAGLDSIIQAGGRCNRENRRSKEESLVNVFELPVEDKSRRLIYNAKEIAATKTVLEVCKTGDDMASLTAIKDYFEILHSLKGKDNLDQKNIMRDLNGRAMPFQDIAKAFKLIEEDTKPIFIVCDDTSRGILHRLEQGERTKEVFRAMGKYVVNVYMNQYQKLFDTSRLNCLDANINVLTDQAVYDEATGLSVDMEGGEGLLV